MYIHRTLENQILPFLDRREAISIVGPRQAGKTTFIEFLGKVMEEKGKKVKFLTFEKKADLDLFEKSIEDFRLIAEQYDCVIIDEFQYAKEGGKKLKYLYDTTLVKFIISGSASLELTFQTGKYMVGRLLEFALSPFSFREFLSYANPELFNLLQEKEKENGADIINFDVKKAFGGEINKRLTESLEKYAVYGGYPAVTLAGGGDIKQKVLEGITENYLLREVKGLLRLATSDNLEKLEKFLAGQIGNMIKFNELSNTSDLPYKEVKKHINILEKTYIISLVKPFFTNKRIELAKNPKAYFFDLGLRNFSLLDFRSINDRNDSGAVMENCAYNLLRNRNPQLPLKYWRTKSKAEVDFVIEKEGRVYPFEVKYSSKKNIGKSLYSFINKFNPPVAIVLTKDFVGEEKIGETSVRFIPLSYL